MNAISVRQHIVLSMLLATAMVALLLHAQPAHAASSAEIERLLTVMMALSLPARPAQAAGSPESDAGPPADIQKNRRCKRLSPECKSKRNADVACRARNGTGECS